MSSSGQENILEAMRLYEQYKRQYGEGAPTGADTAAKGASALERVIQPVLEGTGRVFGGAAQVAGIPARALAAVGTNMAGTGAPIDVSDYAIHGQDLETGRTAPHYGEILAGTLEESGEIAKGGIASKIIAAAGNMITDPAMAPVMLSGAEAAGSLMGRMGPGAAPAPAPATRPMPRSRPHPLSGPIPGGAQPGGGPPGAQPPKLPHPNPKPPWQTRSPRSSADPGATQPVPKYDPNATQPVKFDPNATQPVRGVARVGGELPDTATQPVKTIKPQRTAGGKIEQQFAREQAKPKGAPKKGPKPKKSGSMEEQYRKVRKANKGKKEG